MNFGVHLWSWSGFFTLTQSPGLNAGVFAPRRLSVYCFDLFCCYSTVLLTVVHLSLLSLSGKISSLVFIRLLCNSSDGETPVVACGVAR